MIEKEVWSSVIAGLCRHSWRVSASSTTHSTISNWTQNQSRAVLDYAMIAKYCPVSTINANGEFCTLRNLQTRWWRWWTYAEERQSGWCFPNTSVFNRPAIETYIILYRCISAARRRVTEKTAVIFSSVTSMQLLVHTVRKSALHCLAGGAIKPISPVAHQVPCIFTMGPFCCMNIICRYFRTHLAWESRSVWSFY